uniref:Small ribosomal subunit protein uS3 n=1 Tax=Salmo trutta TaxID=8032 RepID=A0A673ZKF2_SALTR
MAVQISKKRKFVADGIFKAELNEFLTRELAEDGYSGVEVRVTPTRTEIIILATRTQNVLGEKGRRIRELTAVVQKRFGFPEGNVELYAEKVATRGLCAIAQAESLRYKLLGGLAVRRACYGVLRFIMESGSKGCEVVVSGKLRGQRAKSMKFVDGLMIHSGDPVNYYVDTAVRHVLLRQGEMLSFGDDMMTSRNGPRSVSGSGSRSVSLGSVPQSSVSLQLKTSRHLSEKGSRISLVIMSNLLLAISHVLTLILYSTVPSESVQTP